MMFRLVLLSLSALFVAATTPSSHYDSALSMDALYYSKAVVCNRSVLASWTCGSSCDRFPSFSTKGVYYNATLRSQAFQGYDSASNRIVLSFRGSENWRNWITDFDIKFTDYGRCSGCKVHKGFHDEWHSYKAAIMADFQSLMTTYPSASVLVTGHSLGAAVSLLAALDFVVAGTTDVTVYNFGEPRLGNPAFSTWATATMPAGKQFRVTHKQDPVPHVPPMSFGYIHAPHELWYDNDGNTTWKDCNDTAAHEDPTCSDSVLPINPFDHLLYLGIYTGCHAKASAEDHARDVEFAKAMAKWVANSRTYRRGHH